MRQVISCAVCNRQIKNELTSVKCYTCQKQVHSLCSYLIYDEKKDVNLFYCEKCYGTTIQKTPKET